MLEYSLAIHRRFGRFPEQVVPYVGNAPLRMKSELSAPGLSYVCRMVDIREFESKPLLASPFLEDDVLAVLARLGNERDTVRAILNRIAASEAAERGPALSELMVLAGLRKLGSAIETEIGQMPILDDIMDHEVLGRERRRGIELGRTEGRTVGLTEGRTEGKLTLLRSLMIERFGSLPDWANHRLASLPEQDLDRIALRLFHAASLESLFD